MLFQVLCGFEPVFYTTHPNEEPFIIAITITVNVIFSILVAWKGRRKRVFRTEKCK